MGDRYILDLTKCKKLPMCLRGVKTLPLKKGEYEFPYDLVESKISPELLKKMKTHVSQIYKKKNLCSDSHLPIGFRDATLPKNAIINKKRMSKEMNLSRNEK